MRKGRLVLLVLVASAALALASCGSSGNKDKPAGGGTAKDVTLTIANTSGAQWTCGFNPFNPSVQGTTVGFVYETLMFVNTLKNAAETPMLATKYEWSSDKKQLTFTIRDGVKWNDGQAFSAKDVAFTFNLLKKYPGLDLNALWKQILTKVEAKDNTVVFSFKSAAQPYFYYIVDQVAIVPEHVWSTGDAAKDPVQFQDAQPVATGPYKVESCKPANITYAANPDFWQQGKPAVKKVEYPAYTDNSPANQDLANGKAQWGGQFIPNVERYYIARDKENNHIWYPPTSNVFLMFNLKHEITGKKAIRQAFAYAVDRESVSKIGEGGYQPAANQTGIVLPTFQDWYNKEAAESDKYNYQVNATKAKQLLGTEGYSPAKPLKLDVITVSGYTDWDASLQEIKQQLQPIGIDLKVIDVAGQTYNTRTYKGDFDVAYGSGNGGPTPYYELRSLLYSGNTAPLGQNATSNYTRYSDPNTDKLLDEYGAADEAKQKEIINKLQEVMLEDVPVVPTTESVAWFQYSTKDFTGWPTEQDPYALPAPYSLPDVEQVLLHVTPK
jgi:peptide/nickel transport system substrate-binding protein